MTMGYSEYDRIRSKNRLHNEAYEQYQKLKDIGLSNSQILGMCENLSDIVNNTEIRYDILLEIKKIIKSKHEDIF